MEIHSFMKSRTDSPRLPLVAKSKLAQVYMCVKLHNFHEVVYAEFHIMILCGL